MRILFVSNLYPPLSVGGYEQVCRTIAGALRERGHEVHVLTSDHRAAEAPPGEEGVSRRLQLQTLHDLGGDDSRRRLAGPRNAIILDRLARTLRPDVVMVWNGGSLGRPILSAAAGWAPVIYYLHDPWMLPVLRDNGGHPYATARLLAGRTVLRAAGARWGWIRTGNMLFISRALRDQYREAGHDVEGCPVVHNGIDATLYAARPQRILARRAGDPPTLLFCGRIAAQKGVDTLLDGLAILRGRPGLESVRLDLLGPPERPAYREHLEGRVRELGLGDAVAFRDPIPRSEVPAEYGAHDLLVLPSEWNEPFALTMLEAMACAIPLVATLRGGAAEVLVDRDNAYVFPAGDAAALADRVEDALRHPEEAAAVGRRASQKILTEFRLGDQVDQVEAALLRARAEAAA